jgi:hypothetical protein
VRLKNSTDWSDVFLRRMVSWVAKQLELPVRKIRAVEFGNRSEVCWSGRAWGSMKILVRIGPANCYPVEPFHYPGRTNDAYLSPRCEDRMEGLIAVTAHELQHLFDFDHRRSLSQKRNALLRGGAGPQPLVKFKPGERNTRIEERRIVELFRANREALLAEWEVEPAAKPKQTIQEQRFAKVQKALATWQRKAKLAATKIKKYKRQARYYEHAIAATGSK